MNIIIVGGGKIGITLLESLISEGHDVVVIDNDPLVISNISNIYDAMCVCGNGVDCDVLAEASVEKTDIFVAVSGSDETNMLSCFLAKRMGAQHTIARIRDTEYNDQSLSFVRQQLGLSMTINPERLAALELFHILKLPSATNIETFSRRNFKMVELRIKDNSPINGMKIADIKKKYNANFLICSVGRANEVYIPGGDFVIKSGDRIGLTASPNEIVKLLKMLCLMQKQARNVMIVGASRTAFYLTKMLLGSSSSVKVVDLDRDRLRSFSEALPGAVTICGDGAQQEILLEEGLESMDAFVSLTGMDEENILLSFFASSKGVPKVISKINREEFSPMAEKLGLDCLISPKKLVSDVITRYARALQNSLGSTVETLYKIMDGKAEALEFEVNSDFDMLNIPLCDMKLRDNTLIAGILRGRKVIIPSGSDCIMAGDKVIVIAGGHKLRNLSDIIK